MTRFALLLGVAAAVLLAAPVHADKYDPAMTTCRMVYNLKGWSFFYKTQKGEGTITCSNGERAEVRLESQGGGVTVGKSEIIGGEARFTQTRSIEDLYGTYVSAEAHAGVTRSSAAAVMTKGEISLSLSGTGDGIDLGIAFGGMTISPR